MILNLRNWITFQARILANQAKPKSKSVIEFFGLLFLVVYFVVWQFSEGIWVQIRIGIVLELDKFSTRFGLNSRDFLYNSNLFLLFIGNVLEFLKIL